MLEKRPQTYISCSNNKYYIIIDKKITSFVKWSVRQLDEPNVCFIQCCASIYNNPENNINFASVKVLGQIKCHVPNLVSLTKVHS